MVFAWCILLVISITPIKHKSTFFFLQWYKLLLENMPAKTKILNFEGYGDLCSLRISRWNYPDNRDLDKSKTYYYLEGKWIKAKEIVYSTSSVLLLITHTGRGTHRDADRSVSESKYLTFLKTKLLCQHCSPHCFLQPCPPLGSSPRHFCRQALLPHAFCFFVLPALFSLFANPRHETQDSLPLGHLAHKPP